MADDLSNGDVAIIGIANRFPGQATDTDSLWDILLEGNPIETSTSPKSHNFNGDAFYHPDPDHIGTTVARGGYFLDEDPHAFDAPFFGLRAEEVLTLDPQQRLLLENVYHAFENAGLSMNQIKSSVTSVYVGCFLVDLQLTSQIDLDFLTKYRATGTTLSILANRISWFFDLKGASLTIDTACSSSLVAFHHACENIRSGHSEMAVASGVSVIGHPGMGIALSTLGFLSPDSMCHSFDSRANGYARAEGVGTVILKSLPAAIRDGDTIRAVVRGTGVNQDGRTPGLTVPSGQAQEILIRDVYGRAGLDVCDTTYVEAHGTGTRVGDPIEANAVSTALGRCGKKEATPLYIGSIKSTLGHLEGASGIAGIIKAAITVEAGVIPPLAGLQMINPSIMTDQLNVEFPKKSVQWPNCGPRRASVNSFGYGGTNAHAIIDDAPSYLLSKGISCESYTQSLVDEPEISPQIIVYSSFDASGIERNLSKLKQWLDKSIRLRKNVNRHRLADLAYTLSERRSSLPWKAFTIANSIEDLTLQLHENLPKEVRSTHPPGLGFVFTGQGSQWARMGQALMRFPTYRKSLEQATEYMAKMNLGWNLLDELDKDAAASSIDEPLLAQSATPAIQVAMVELLASWNIYPSRVVGHSSGEIAAAFAAGHISREAAWRLACVRGSLASRTTSKSGGMLAVGLSPEELAPYLDAVNAKIEGELSIGCFNSPKNVTVSGDMTKIDLLKSMLESDGRFSRKLAVKNAYHSGHMRHLGSEYEVLLKEIPSGSKLELPHEVEMFSSLKARQVTQEEVTQGQYWAQNFMFPVKFSQALVKMMSNQVNGTASDKSRDKTDIGIIIELGPHSTLRSAVRETLQESKEFASVQYANALSRDDQTLGPILKLAGLLYCHGHSVPINAINKTILGAAKVVYKPKLLVDLPPYAFNHSQGPKTESRISKNIRHRKFPRHDLLGAPVSDWDPSQPRWKNIICTRELPWVLDHKVNGKIIYPGVGYLIMAIEGMKQLVDTKLVLQGIELKDISFTNMLIVPETKEGVEITLTMRKTVERGNLSSWYHFRISSYDYLSNDWVDHCTGMIEALYETPLSQVDKGRSAAEERAQLQQQLKRWEDMMRKEEKIESFYDSIRTYGYDFGPTFRNLVCLKATGDSDSGEVVGVVSIPDIAQVMPKQFVRPHIIQPPTMDTLVHMVLVLLLKPNKNGITGETGVPSFIKDVWLSNAIVSSPYSKFKVYGQSEKVSTGKRIINATAWDVENEEAMITVKGIQFSSLQSKATTKVDSSIWRRCLHSDWVYDVQLNSSLPLVNKVKIKSSHDIEYSKKLQLACAIFIQKAASELSDVDADSLQEPHQQKYLKWLRMKAAEIKQGHIGFQDEEWASYFADNELCEEIFKDIGDSTAGQLILRVGKSITGILRNDINALSLLFSDDLLDRWYQDQLGENLRDQINQYLSLLGQSSTGLKVLEVGAGTGSLTELAVPALSPVDDNDEDEVSNMVQYVFTDISAAFFAKAREKFSKWQHVMRFQQLNIEDDPSVQGFESGTYDIVLVSLVLHATANLEKTLTNCRALLKPGGKLVFVEKTTEIYLGYSFCFGILPGWWLSTEPWREWSPTVGKEKWTSLLHKTGFSKDVLIVDDDTETELQVLSMFAASASPLTLSGKFQLSPAREVTIVCASKSQMESQIVELVQVALIENGVNRCTTCQVQDLINVDLKHIVCVSMLGYFNFDLSTAEEYEFLAVRHLLLSCTDLLWVTGDMTANPELSLITGLLRTIRLERKLQEPNLVLLELVDQTSVDMIATSIGKFYYQQLLSRSLLQNHSEYQLRGETFFTTHLVESKIANSHLRHHTRGAPPLPPLIQELGSDTSRALKLSSGSLGMLNKLQFVDDESCSGPLDPSEVKVKIQANGLNFRDILTAIGQFKDDTRFGFEAAGTVIEVGSNIQHLHTGDCVAIIPNQDGLFKTIAHVSGLHAIRIPKGLSLEEAASIPMNFMTALHSLRNIAKLSKGETVLIHAAAGGTGQAAIQIALAAGAEVFATVSSVKKKELIMAEYGILEDHIFSSRDFTFKEGIMRKTANKGVDVVINSLSGEALRRTWECVASYGRFIELGKRDGWSNGSLDMSPFVRNILYAGVDIDAMCTDRPVYCNNLLTTIFKMFDEGIIHTVRPLTVLGYNNIISGFRDLQSGKAMGKIVFRPQDDDLIPVVPRTLSPYTFKTNATYVLAGGLGGIGRSIATWMVSRGARHLMFLSRSGVSNKAAHQTVEDLQRQACRVAILKCDISDAKQLENGIKLGMQDFPPIKGCIQAAMSLHDVLFENMSHDQFQSAIKPKVSGSWNLHNLLPTDMDFFVMLASMIGVTGNRGQSNYGAGNVYEDMLSKFRISKGLPSMTLDLGPVDDVGYIAEQGALNAELVDNPHYSSISADQVHSMIEYAIDPRMKKDSYHAVSGVNYLFRNTTLSTANTVPRTNYALRQLLASASTVDDAEDVVLRGIQNRLGGMLDIDNNDIDVRKPMNSYGVDSLVAVELRDWIAKEMGAQIPNADIIGNSSIRDMSKKVVSISDAVNMRESK